LAQYLILRIIELFCYLGAKPDFAPIHAGAKSQIPRGTSGKDSVAKVQELKRHAIRKEISLSQHTTDTLKYQ